MIRKTTIAVAVAAVCLAASLAFADDKDDKRERRGHEQKHDRHDRDDHGKRHEKDKDRHGDRHTQVKVPPGHLPPPGECRIWFPDRPAGHQPPPGDCRELSRRVPHGAVLVEGG
jgi:ABC-type Zn2+ transport system substrate-binding protein/surface adhesin